VQYLTEEEADAWLFNNKVRKDDFIHNEEYTKFDFKIPPDSGIKNFIAKQISNLLKDEKIFLYITEHGIWSSAENMELFNGYRKYLGIEQNIYKRPAHVFDENENIEFYCILTMILYFVWGGILINESKQVIIVISHDEFIDIYIKKDYKKEFISTLIPIFKE
jgi:hypothetical protein